MRDCARSTIVHLQTDLLGAAPSFEVWWDMPVAEVAGIVSTRTARAGHEQHRCARRTHLSTREEVKTQ